MALAPVKMPSSGRTSPRLPPSLPAGHPPAESTGPEPPVSGASPSARRADGGILRPSANASNVEVAVGRRLRVLYSLSRPCGMPVRTESWPCVMPCAQHRNHRAEVAARTCVEHVLARANALHYLPDGRDVHCHGALPVPLVARLPRGGNCLPIIHQRTPMSFVSGFNLTASFIPLMTFSRGK